MKLKGTLAVLSLLISSTRSEYNVWESDSGYEGYTPALVHVASSTVSELARGDRKTGLDLETPNLRGDHPNSASTDADPLSGYNMYSMQSDSIENYPYTEEKTVNKKLITTEDFKNEVFNLPVVHSENEFPEINPALKTELDKKINPHKTYSNSTDEPDVSYIFDVEDLKTNDTPKESISEKLNTYAKKYYKVMKELIVKLNTYAINVYKYLSSFVTGKKLESEVDEETEQANDSTLN